MADHSMIADLHIAEMLKDILASGRVVLLTQDGRRQFFGDAGLRKSSAKTLEGCLEALTDHPRVKICARAGCVARGCPIPLSEFGPDKDAADGHANACRSCESKRIAAREKRKRTEPLAEPAAEEPHAAP